jgi:hypothetical protein
MKHCRQTFCRKLVGLLLYFIEPFAKLARVALLRKRALQTAFSAAYSRTSQAQKCCFALAKIVSE